jgi:hypothetical protein
VTCGKPALIPRDIFIRWFMTKPAEKFVPLREFLADYCTCDASEKEISNAHDV